MKARVGNQAQGVCVCVCVCVCTEGVCTWRLLTKLVNAAEEANELSSVAQHTHQLFYRGNRRARKREGVSVCEGK